MNIQELKAAGMHDDADAQFALGERYENGNGVPFDLKQAFWWYMKAAGL